MARRAAIRERTSEGGLQEVGPPQDLVHGSDGAELGAPVLDLDDARQARQEDHPHGARQGLHGGRAFARLELVQPSHGELPQRPDLHHQQEGHRPLREEHQKQQRDHPPPSRSAPLPFPPPPPAPGIGARLLNNGAGPSGDLFFLLTAKTEAK